MAPLTSQPTPTALWGVPWGAGDTPPPLYPCSVFPWPSSLCLVPLLHIYQAIHCYYQICVLSDAVHALLVPIIALPWASCECWLASQQQLRIEHIKGCELSGTCDSQVHARVTRVFCAEHTLL